ncbi:hypothetical protein J2Z23_004402 [Lederbergia galactosidilyticus]|uniref:heparinase II/III domain-containing protein n=1 Tax=Lederbergia galactosidilytica TaxID=217031 RepID=UPI001AE6880C|nr:heparinase II/III family protein [Lederbergia galactosidilytica]MBP1917397.1 hypothetical protein [Lederbergia galactosidilytica]
MLSPKYKVEELRKWIIPLEEYKPFPTVEERDKWEAITDPLRMEQMKEAEIYLNYTWPSLPANFFMDFVRNGNRTRYENPSFQRRSALASLVIAECLESEGRFLDDIINGIWCICEESFWGVPAHNNLNNKLPNVSEPIIDLFAGETAGLLSLTYYFLKSRLDQIDPLICNRIQLEVKRRILDPYLTRDDFWWMGLATKGKVNNWNPWCNSNCLMAFLFLEDDFERRVQAVEKALHSLDCFLNVYHEDGGCDEGTMYWGRAGGSLFDCLELLYSGSNGKIDMYSEPLIKEIGRYLYKSYIDGEYFTNFADGGAIVKISSNLVYRYGCRIDDKKLMSLGSSAFHLQRKVGKDKRLNSLNRQIHALFDFEEMLAATSTPPYVRDVWLKDIQVMAAREEEGSSKGLYLAAKGGHNDESHNHNDIGQFIVYSDGSPFIIDVGVETYTSKTFGPNRYDIWTMQSAYHNLPTINGIQQGVGEQFKATQVKQKIIGKDVRFSLNLDSAYPKKAGIGNWERQFTFHRGNPSHIEICDKFQLKRTTKDVSLSLMIPFEPQLDQAGSIIIQNANSKGIKVDYDADNLIATTERIIIEDEKLGSVWGEQVFRVTLKAKSPIKQASWKLRICQL